MTSDIDCCVRCRQIIDRLDFNDEYWIGQGEEWVEKSPETSQLTTSELEERQTFVITGIPDAILTLALIKQLYSAFLRATAYMQCCACYFILVTCYCYLLLSCKSNLLLVTNFEK